VTMARHGVSARRGLPAPCVVAARRGTSAARAFAVAAALVLGVFMARPSAHPSSTTAIAVAVADAQTLSVTITADADSLITKLEALGGGAIGAAPTTTAERTARLTALGAALRAQIDLRLDATTATLALRDVAVNDAGQATLTLVASIPAAARTLTWRSSFTYGSYPLALRRLDRSETVVWLQGPDASEALVLDGGSQHLPIGRGIWMGFTHILPRGLDHILFVIGLFLLSTKPRQVLAQVSAFTVAHSMTLGLSLYGVFSLPGGVVEPLIAL
jgi:hypothetical protein